MNHSKVSYEYERDLAYCYHVIDNRGLKIDETLRQSLKHEVQAELDRNCMLASAIWGCTVFVGREKDDGSVGACNINSTKGEKALLKKLQEIGYKVPKIRKKNDEGDTEFKESTCDLALQRLLAENQFKYPNGDPAIRAILDVRELITLRNRYLNAKLHGGVFYSNYNVAGTLTGRRGSKKHIFGVGGNAQNFPKHSVIGKRFRDCIIPREGHIFFSVDQISAEDWPVSALAENEHGLGELRSGVDRHTKLASAIFEIPIANIAKDSMERYLGKKTRHANNYGMKGQRMSDSLAQEGYSYAKEICQSLLNKANQIDPNISQVFHKYIKEQIYNSRTLRTPLGRERYFFGLRDNAENYEILNEAYAYIPQSTVGDNTGMAVLRKFLSPNYIVNEAHDSYIEDIPEREECLREAFKTTKDAFNRVIRFHNGIEINIPIEGETGYSLNSMTRMKEFSEDCLIETWTKVKKEREEKKEQELINAPQAI